MRTAAQKPSSVQRRRHLAAQVAQPLFAQVHVAGFVVAGQRLPQRVGARHQAQPRIQALAVDRRGQPARLVRGAEAGMRRAHVRVGGAVHFDGAVEDRVARQAVVVQVFNIHVPLSVGFAPAHAKARLGQRQRRPAMQPVARGVQAPVQGVELLRDGPMASGSTSMRNSAGRCHAVRMEPAGRKAGRDGDRGANKATARNSGGNGTKDRARPMAGP